MHTHEQKVQRIVEQLQRHTSTDPVSFQKKAVSHEVPKPQDARHGDEKIDISDLTEVLHIDAENRLCTAESGVTFVDLVKETLKYQLVPCVVPELKTITIGGAVAGCSIESMSYRLGGFHDSCMEYELITASGEVLTCKPDNEHQLLFQMIHGTFGTLGVLSKLTFRLVPAKRFVHVTYESYPTPEAYQAAIWQHYESRDVDFMDGIIHSPTLFVLSTGNFVDVAPYTHRYDWMRVYYRSTRERSEDYLETADYFFRYDKGVTNVTPSSFIGRLLFGKFIDSARLLTLVHAFRRFIPDRLIPVTLDTFIPFSRFGEFMVWYQQEVNHFPLWCVPYKLVRPYEWISEALMKKNKDELFLDIAIYGLPKHPQKNYYRMFEEELMRINGIKTLIAGNYYSEEEFWTLWNKPNYDAAKQRTDPKNIFRNLYTKTCRAMRGMR
jgi:FAD/FMN-containing dehydrogenase